MKTFILGIVLLSLHQAAYAERLELPLSCVVLDFAGPAYAGKYTFGEERLATVELFGIMGGIGSYDRLAPLAYSAKQSGHSLEITLRKGNREAASIFIDLASKVKVPRTVDHLLSYKNTFAMKGRWLEGADNQKDALCQWMEQ